MDKSNEMKSVKKLLEDVIRLMKDQPELRAIDRDLALEKLRQAYELLLFEKPASMIPDSPSPLVEEKEVEKPSPVEIEDGIQESEIQNDEIAEEELIPNSEDRLKEVIPVEEKPQAKQGPLHKPAVEVDLFDDTEEVIPNENISTEASVSQDLFSSVTEPEPTDTLSDALSRKLPKETLIDQFQKNKIEHLKDTIGINEKFFFLNELFDGDLTNYNQAIDTLDAFQNADEAHAYIDSLSEQYSWAEHDQAKEQFLEFIHRKFANR